MGSKLTKDQLIARLQGIKEIVQLNKHTPSQVMQAIQNLVDEI